MNSSLPLSLEKISFKVNNKYFLREINVKIKEGLPKVIMGPNGSGKTLLMRIAHGVLRPTSGRVYWSGSKTPPLYPRQTMVFQKPIMLNRSVETNLAFALNPVKKTSREKKKIIAEALKKIKLLEKIKVAARSLSQGEQQKLAIIRSAILNPEIIFLDEPTSNIDPQATIEIEQLIMDISRDGSQVVMSTHNIKQAERIAGSIIFMLRGRILKDTSSESFFLKDQHLEIRQFLNNV